MFAPPVPHRFAAGKVKPTIKRPLVVGDQGQRQRRPGSLIPNPKRRAAEIQGSRVAFSGRAFRFVEAGPRAAFPRVWLIDGCDFSALFRQRISSSLGLLLPVVESVS